MTASDVTLSPLHHLPEAVMQSVLFSVTLTSWVASQHPSGLSCHSTITSSYASLHSKFMLGIRQSESEVICLVSSEKTRR